MMREKEADILYIKKRKVKHWLVILVLLCLILVAIRVRIRDIRVLGNKMYTSEQAEELVFSDYWDRNTAVCLAKQLLKKKKTLPFVQDYVVSLTGPFSCDLIIYEKNPIGCIIYMSNYMYFDKDGIMVESSPEKLEDIPVIRGLQFGHVVLGKPLPAASRQVFNEIMSLTQQFHLYGIACDSIRFDEYRNITVELDEGRIEVYLGSSEDILAKLSALNDMLPAIRERGLTGTLDLSSYDDKQKGSSSSFKIREVN
jgi:cell division protein FtsQ